MDIASVIGLLLAVGLILGSIATGSAPFSAFIDIPSVLVVIGGSLGAAFICFPLQEHSERPDGRQEGVSEQGRAAIPT